MQVKKTVTELLPMNYSLMKITLTELLDEKDADVIFSRIAR
jgi:hypothetical protein